MKKVALAIALTLLVAATALAAADRPVVAAGGTHGKLDRPTVPHAGTNVIDILLEHPNLERNNVRAPGIFKADKALLQTYVRKAHFRIRRPKPDAKGIVPTFSVQKARAFSVLGPVVGEAHDGPQQPTYTFQIRLEAGKLLKKRRIYDAKLIDYRGTWLLYLTNPGGEDWSEEWILRR